MGEKEKNKEWFNQVADRLREHEEPYKSGSWEQFSAQHAEVIQPRRGGLFPLWIKYGAAGLSAAALILIGIFLLWPAPEIMPEMASAEVEVGVKIGIGESSDVVSSDAVSSAEMFASGITSATLPHVTESKAVTKKANLVMVNLVSNKGLSKLSKLTTGDIRLANQVFEPVLDTKSMDARSVGERLSALTEFSEASRSVSDASSSILASSDHTGRWNMGLVLAPNVTTEQVNIGGGLAVTYRLTNKLSLQTGISLGQYGVNTQSFIPGTQASGPSGPIDSPVAPPSGGTGASGATGSTDKEFESMTPAYHTRYLNSQTSRLLGMDIPIELKYEVSDRFYTAFGLSVFGVLEENRTNHYVDRINEPLTMDGANSSYSVRTLYVDERASKHPMDGHTYTGFLNFSIGHQTQISRKLRFSVEPFFKLPIGSLAKEDMNLTNGGIRIITGF